MMRPLKMTSTAEMMAMGRKIGKPMVQAMICRRRSCSEPAARLALY